MRKPIKVLRALWRDLSPHTGDPVTLAHSLLFRAKEEGASKDQLYRLRREVMGDLHSLVSKRGGSKFLGDLLKYTARESQGLEAQVSLPVHEAPSAEVKIAEVKIAEKETQVEYMEELPPDALEEVHTECDIQCECPDCEMHAVMTDSPQYQVDPLPEYESVEEWVRMNTPPKPYAKSHGMLFSAIFGGQATNGGQATRVAKRNSLRHLQGHPFFQQPLGN